MYKPLSQDTIIDIFDVCIFKPLQGVASVEGTQSGHWVTGVPDLAVLRPEWVDDHVKALAVGECLLGKTGGLLPRLPFFWGFLWYGGCRSIIPG
jgi:hypothetical protein